MSEISSLDLGSPVSPVSPVLPGPSTRSANLTNLVHEFAVKIACHMVRDRLPEAKAFLEVEACIKATGSIPIIETSQDDTLERQLSTTYSWQRALISDWVSTPSGGSLQ